MKSSSEVKDDRPSDNISFAATNLVKPGLSSRRQQSEPPINRDGFPPTPPPENEKVLPSRGASVRNGPKPQLAKLSIQTQESPRRYEKANSPPDARPRPTRSASATPSRAMSQRDPPPLQRRPTRRIEEEEEEAYPGEVYDMYAPPRRGSQASNGRMRSQPRYIEDDASDYDDGSVDEGDFDMIPVRRPTAASSVSSTRSRRGPEVRKIRVKAHSADDVRYIMIGAAVEYPDFLDRVRDKFGLAGRKFKIKMKDEDMPDGQMITMGDQDDLEMALSSARTAAKRARQEAGKMDVSLDTF